MTELDALLLLNAIPGLSNLKKRKLVSFYGSAKAVLNLTKKDLEEDNLLSIKNIENILHFSKDKFLKDEYNLIAAHGVALLVEGDPGYPDLLKNIDDNPLILYVKGTVSLEPGLSVAIVGSRRSSLSGRLVAEKFAYALASEGYAVISGLARGIDTFAHQGALRAQGKTIAVLGSGLACIYPQENKKLFFDISSTSAVISEYPMATLPLPYNFPRRNRIISGLSIGVIVVEAASRSGALITADFALDQGREVFAVPCNIESPTAKGVNNLIKQGAHMVTEIQDVLDILSEMPWCPEKNTRVDLEEKEKELFCDFDEGASDSDDDEEKQIWACLKDSPVHVDELAGACGLSSSLTAAVLLQLELKNKVEQLPGKLFRKVSLKRK